MLITKLIEEDKSKIKIFIDEEYAFWLYKKDIIKYEIAEENEISPEAFNELLSDIVYNRAKQKALSLLKFMDRSEYEIRKKMTDAGYPETITTSIISYLHEYNYLNDERFASNYIRLRKERKSKLVIRTELLSKGIDKCLIDRSMSEEYLLNDEDSEEIAIKKAIAKKTSDPSSLSWEEKQKLIASLYRKGYDIEKIKHNL